MKPRSRAPRDPADSTVSRSAPTINSREDAELAAIALLCLLFASPPEEAERPTLRLVPE